LDAYRKLSTQILIHLGASPDMMCGHKEWAPKRKVDPISLDMNSEREKVGDLMSGWNKPGDPVVDLDDARAVNAYQGWGFWSEADFDYDENDPKFLDERNKIISARMVDWMMRHP
jgi:hypothetical protein